MNKKVKKDRIMVMSGQGPISLSGFNIGDSGLGFFKSKEHTPKKGLNWSLTHLESGRAICRFKTRKALVNRLEEILQLVDWSLEKDILTVRTTQNKQVIERLKQIQNEEL